MRWLQRSVGLAILGTATLGAVLLWIGVATSDPGPSGRPKEGLLFGVWRVFYATDKPDDRVLVAAAGAGLLLAAAVALLERRITNRARRSENPRRTPLAPKLVMASTRGV